MSVGQAGCLRDGDDTMSAQFDPTFEADLAYRTQRLREDFRHDEPSLLHWWRGRRQRHDHAAR